MTVMMMMKGDARQACAACKFQRRKCTPECPLALYFPSDKPAIFHNVHRLFGVKKLIKTLESIGDPSQRAEAMTSMIYQANMRKMFPVHGCCQVIGVYRYKIQQLEQELHAVYAELEVPTTLELGMAASNAIYDHLLGVTPHHQFFNHSSPSLDNIVNWMGSPCTNNSDDNNDDDKEDDFFLLHQLLDTTKVLQHQCAEECVGS